MSGSGTRASVKRSVTRPTNHQSAAGGKEANELALVGYRSTARPMALNNCDRNSFARIVYVIAVMPSSPRG